jgi:hypothetical protein
LIGGEYYLKSKPVDDSLLYSLSSLSPSYAWFSSGRDALFSLLTNEQSPRIWLPDFICKAIVDLVQQVGKTIQFYPITEQLQPESQWIAQLQSGDLVFISHFFGITPHDILEKLAQTDAVVISDVSHTVFHHASWKAIAKKSSYLFSSLRKTMAVPDGAYVGSLSREIAAPVETADAEFWAARAAALLSRGGSSNQGFMSAENVTLFKQAEYRLDSHPAAARKISDCSRSILATMSESEWETDRMETHHNQAILATHLSDQVVCPQVKPTRTLPEIALCTFFILLLEPDRRDKVKQVLADQRIYCPVHWDTAFLTREHPLSKKILSVPCDARYTDRDMKYIATIINAQR